MATLGNPQETIAILQKYQFNFQKKFGQNFLIDTHVLDKIIAAADITKDDLVLEIGPGIGTMTQYLCENAREVVAVEIDKNLIPILEDTLSAYDNVTVINGDILKVDINKIVEERNNGKPIKVVANLPYYITTPIYYPSDNLHIGHAYCTTIADSLARFHRLKGEDVFFLTGSDEHGLKIQRKAKEKGVTPIQYVDAIIANFKLLWKELNISNNDFIRTSQERHHKVVQDALQKIYEQGDIYKKNYKGLYCVPCESYWLERQLDENHCCPDCHRPVEEMEEESYFFKMSKYQDWWLQFIEEHPDFIQPASRRNEMINFVKHCLL